MCHYDQDMLPAKGGPTAEGEPSDWLTSTHLSGSFLGFSFLLVLQGRFGETLFPRGSGTHVLRRLLLVLTETHNTTDNTTHQTSLV